MEIVKWRHQPDQAGFHMYLENGLTVSIQWHSGVVRRKPDGFFEGDSHVAEVHIYRRDKDARLFECDGVRLDVDRHSLQEPYEFTTKLICDVEDLVRVLESAKRWSEEDTDGDFPDLDEVIVD